MRALVTMSWFILCVGCSPTGSITGDQQDASPIKLPPEGKPGGETAPGCDGVPAAGKCENGTAQYCDVANGTLRQVDCRALGQECVVSPSQGASCLAIEGATPNPGGPCDGVINDKGMCSANGTAIWCDAASNQIVAWSCADDGLACGVDQCQSGAYCCAESPPPVNECDTLGFYGECADQVARYCTSNNTLVEIDCQARGKVCALDECATGAYCCDPPQSECERLGVYGECGGTTGNTARYCIGQTLYERDCGTDICVLDVCFNGADCCTQAEYDYVCQGWDYYGACAGRTGNTVVWCDTQGVIQRQECEDFGQVCAIDQCGTGAQCCDAP